MTGDVEEGRKDEGERKRKEVMDGGKEGDMRTTERGMEGRQMDGEGGMMRRGRGERERERRKRRIGGGRKEGREGKIVTARGKKRRERRVTYKEDRERGKDILKGRETKGMEREEEKHIHRRERGRKR